MRRVFLLYHTSYEAADHVFVFIDETYTGETAEVELQNGATISVDAAEYKGKLFVTEQ